MYKMYTRLLYETIRGLRVNAFWYPTRPVNKSLLPYPIRTRRSNCVPDPTRGYTRRTRTRMPPYPRPSGSFNFCIYSTFMELTSWFGSAMRKC